MAFLRAFVFLIACLTIMGWGLSWWNCLDWLGRLSVAGFLSAIKERRGERSSSAETLAAFP
ncbi:MAG: hypothetical protein ABSH15_02655 [Verrucomicrobiota bacterium]|jgi:hypothetical protein